MNDTKTNATNTSDILLNKIAESNTIVAAAIKNSSECISNTYKHIDSEIGKILQHNQGGVALQPDLVELNKSLMRTIFSVLESNVHSGEIQAKSEKDS